MPGHSLADEVLPRQAKAPPTLLPPETKARIAVPAGTIDQVEARIAGAFARLPSDVSEVTVSVGVTQRIFDRKENTFNKNGTFVERGIVWTDVPSLADSRDESRYRSHSDESRREDVVFALSPAERDAENRLKAFLKELNNFYRDERGVRTASELNADKQSAARLGREQSVLFAELNGMTDRQREMLRRVNSFIEDSRAAAVGLGKLGKLAVALDPETVMHANLFGKALAECAQSGIKMKFPNVPRQLACRNIRKPLFYPYLPDEYYEEFDLEAATKRASERALARGEPKGYSEIKDANGHYYYLGGGRDAAGKRSSEHAWTKIYGCIIPEEAPAFLENIIDWARSERVTPNLTFKFFPLEFFMKSTHNKLCMYVPFEETPRVVRFIATQAGLFEQKSFNHWLGVHLMPGVSAVIEGGGGTSFDDSVSKSLSRHNDRTLKKVFLGNGDQTQEGKNGGGPMMGEKASGLLVLRETRAYFAYILRDRIVPPAGSALVDALR